MSSAQLRRGFLFLILIIGIWFLKEIPIFNNSNAVFSIKSEISKEMQTQEAPLLQESASPIITDKTESPKEIELTQEDQQKLQIFDEILITKNDNDPRLDSELKVLSEGMKIALKNKYSTYAPEKRAEKGMIAFLLGRNLSTDSDMNFMHEILLESECLSLEDCNIVAPLEPHHQDTDAITLAYPQIMALQMVSKVPEESPLRSKAQMIIHQARNSKIKLVSQAASELTK